MTRLRLQRAGARHLAPRVPAHVATTRHLGAAYPMASEAGLGAEGVVIGRDLLGGSFVYDPFVLYRAGVITNPNMVVFGQIGRGKSAFVKSYLWRQAIFGRRAWVVDPKGEYGPLADAWGVTPLVLRPGGPVRLNPLDVAGSDPGVVPAGASRSCGDAGEDAAGEDAAGEDAAGEVWRRRARLIASLAVACLGRDLLPRERAAIDAALHAATAAAAARSRPPTLPDVVDALLAPGVAAAAELRTGVERLLEDGRDVALELRRLVTGDLRGMFDGLTSPGIALDGPLVVLDLSAVYDSPALGVLMACASAWLQGAVRAAGGNRVILVVDEAWAILANLGVARWLQASWKLARASGVANVAVLHRLSDLAAVGAAGSEQVGLAAGLLADSETRVIYGQAPGEAERAADLLALTSTEAELVTGLRRGVALWKVGPRSFLVEHQLGPAERTMVDTDGAMAPASPASGPAGGPPSEPHVVGP